MTTAADDLLDKLIEAGNDLQAESAVAGHYFGDSGVPGSVLRAKWNAYRHASDLYTAHLDSRPGADEFLGVKLRKEM